ncbi:hypothetical protein [Falsiroseomonas sp. HW251]|uniref:hypothetical protein n=1 Tax=Falsiroseomonas sp. HW251 TaxID=3390998 RepID=UPI003D315B2A
MLDGTNASRSPSAIVTRISDNHLRGELALAAGQEHRSRSSTWLTESTLIVVDLLQLGPDDRSQIVADLGSKSGEGNGPNEHDAAALARLVMGSGIDPRRAYRVAAAARQLVLLRPNDPREAISAAGGVSALATAWGQRDGDTAGDRGKRKRLANEPTRAADPEFDAVVARATHGISTELTTTRGKLYAVIEVSAFGELTILAVDNDIGRLAASGR